MQTAFDRLIATPEGREAYCYEATATGVRELIWKLLDERGMSQGELAQQMGVTAGRVSQLLDGRANLTLATIAKTLSVFGCVLKVDVDPLIPVQRCEEEWKDIVGSIGLHRYGRIDCTAVHHGHIEGTAVHQGQIGGTAVHPLTDGNSSNYALSG